MEIASAQRVLPVSSLLLDTSNPRLTEVQASQYDTILSMVKSQGEKLINLAQHLVKHGPNPASLLIVTPAIGNSLGAYTVLDGNRRVAALKLLESPNLVEEIVDAKLYKRLKQHSSEFQKNPISTMNCIVVPSIEDADTWIVLIHRGQQQGAGLVEWDGQVAARYDARKSDKTDLALEVLDLVRHHGEILEHTQRVIDEGKFPITSLRRLLGTRYVRDKLGIEVGNDGKLRILYPLDDVTRGLARIVDDLGTGTKTVSDLKSQTERINYVNEIPDSILPQPERALDVAEPVVISKSSEKDSPPNSPLPISRNRVPKPRTTLIPLACKLNVTQPRIQQIYKELRSLNIEQYPNAGAVMLRVLLELSLDEYIEKKLKWSDQQIANSKLADKLDAVIKHFEHNQILTPNQLAPIKKAAAGQTLLAAAIKTLHGYVHNKHFSPIASEIKTAWDDLQPFMEKLWP